LAIAEGVLRLVEKSQLGDREEWVGLFAHENQ
jgi:hypothetical protein